MEKMLYVKYNRFRRAQFQTVTKLVETDGKKYAIKQALLEDANGHIEAFFTNYEQLKTAYKNIDFLEPKAHIREDGLKEVAFDFVEGKSMQNHVHEVVLSGTKEEIVKTVSDYLQVLLSVDESYLVDFDANEKFTEIFALQESFINALSNKKCTRLANVDIILDNIVLLNDRWTMLDYEWIITGTSVPLDYLKYRVLFYLYERLEADLKKNFSTYNDFFEAFGLEKSDSEIFYQMEEGFQEYVFGQNRCERYLDNYIEPVTALETEKTTSQALLLMQNERMKQAIVDKDRHIRNLEKQLKAEHDHQVHMTNMYLKYSGFFTIKVARKLKHMIPQKPKSRRPFELPYFENPKVSIVIPVYNQFEYTYDCIESIVNTVKDIPYEIIIGDDESKDKTRRAKRYFKGVVVNKNTGTHGFVTNCNEAAKLARGEYIVFLNNDTTVCENWLSSMLRLFEIDKKAGLVGSKLVYPNGELQEAGAVIWSDGSGLNYGRGCCPDDPQYNYVREVDYCSGASIMIPASLWKQLGGFDEQFIPAYCEDVDLAFAVRAAGYKVLYQPKSVVTHFEGVSNGTDLSSGLKQYQTVNVKKLQEKWSDELKNHFAPGINLFSARERNFNKPVILFVDHHVPTFDQDAGSKNALGYIKMFLEKGYIVKFVGDDFKSIEPYTSALQEMGVEVIFGDWYQDNIFEWIKANENSIDFVYLNRPHIAEHFIDFLKEKTNIRVLYCGQDLHFLRMAREAELENSEEKRIESMFWKEREFAVMRQCEMNYYPSVLEIEEIKKYDETIPAKMAPVYIYDSFKEDYKYDASNREGILFVGGFAHTPNCDAVRFFLNEVFPKVREKIDVNFYIVGSRPPEDIQNMQEDGVIVKGFVSDEDLAKLYEQVRMVVVPLRYGAGVKGKVIEAIHEGLPIVTTDIGAEGIIDIDNLLAIANDADDFANTVINLYQDEAALEKMAMATQDYIKKYFSLDAVWNIVEGDFK